MLIYEYVGGLLHTKSLTLDGEITLIGSANMDRRSFDLNYENNILFYDKALTADVLQRQEELYRPIRTGHARERRRLELAAATVEQHHRHARAGVVMYTIGTGCQGYQWLSIGDNHGNQTIIITRTT